jgi:ribosomal protein S18 acetylase RimI-like enzyme
MNINSKIWFEDANDDIKEFLRKEWRSANLIHFGRDISEEISQPLTLAAYDNSSSPQLVGVARCLIVGKTLRVSQLLVKEEYRESQGIGSFMLKELEELAMKQKWHKIRLSTSKKHQNITFYQKNDYVIEATLKNDAFHTTWYILSKFLD